ncbi:hypothetical protein AAG570_008994 [Ranatra chinensis]|uniref:Uncharacterized protein n=1 Tax=Ranatra chinensis TaxID=642074 RepID=A0ABD0YSK8_9HEMI
MAFKRRNIFYENKNRVEDRLGSEWFSPGYYVTQIIGGHGNFVTKLAGFGLRDEGNCTCGVPETVGHVTLALGFGEMGGGGLELDKMVGKEEYENFVLLVKNKIFSEILERKELEEWKNGSGSAMQRRGLVVVIDRNSYGIPE